MSKTWVEVAVNGPWGRALQPGIPVTVTEIVEAALAAHGEGAAIVHLHAYDPATGRQDDSGETYARIIEAVRSRADVLVYPTIPLAGSALTGGAADAVARFAHIEFLAARGLIEMAVVDPGSVNFTRIDRAGAAAGFIYMNPEDHVLRGLEVAAARGVTPSYAIYEPGFARLGAALAARFPGMPVPLYRIMFSDAFGWGFPPRGYGLDAHLALLAEVAREAPWMIAGLGVDLTGLIAEAVSRGGHVRVGLEDAPFGEPRSNAELVAEAVRIVRQAGGEPATAADVRAGLVAAGRIG